MAAASGTARRSSASISPASWPSELSSDGGITPHALAHRSRRRQSRGPSEFWNLDLKRFSL
uniref:Uncharacterized protein n=1 Tax=Arundo donax TaxID=35708 RepID=A0A0A9HPM9_ARUDO